EDLRGAFVIALWDDKNQRLILVSDRMGLKTIYWTQEGDALLFASRAGAVCAAKAGSSDVNRPAILQYLLFSVVPAPLSAYKGIERLEPGRLVVFENGHSSNHSTGMQSTTRLMTKRSRIGRTACAKGFVLPCTPISMVVRATRQ